MNRFIDPQPTRLDRARFHKSTRSNSSSDGNCVAAAVDGSAVAVGDTKLPTTDGSFKHLLVTRRDWTGFIAAVKLADAEPAGTQYIRARLHSEACPFQCRS